MKSLNTLIKLHKRNLDELRRKMGVLENQKSQLQLASQKLQEELEKEIKLAARQQDMAQFFGDFAKRIKKRQEDIAQEIRELEKQMIKLNEEITREFAELKKYEIAKENKLRRQHEEQARKDTIALDEIAGQQFQRKKKE